MKTKITYKTSHEGQTKVRTSVNSIHSYTHCIWRRHPQWTNGQWECKNFCGSLHRATKEAGSWKSPWETVVKEIDEIITKEVKSREGA